MTPPSGVTDPNLGNNSATDTNTVTTGANLALTKTDGSATYTPGGTATYSITVTNSGPANAASLSVVDNLPSRVTLTAMPTCTAVGAATCGSISGAAGGTSFTATGATITAGVGNRLIYSLPVLFAASLTAQQITNTATASDPSGRNHRVGLRHQRASEEQRPGAADPATDPGTLLLLSCLILLFRVALAAITSGTPRPTPLAKLAASGQGPRERRRVRPGRWRKLRSPTCSGNRTTSAT